jgi:hypothetical protein
MGVRSAHCSVLLKLDKQHRTEHRTARIHVNAKQDRYDLQALGRVKHRLSQHVCWHENVLSVCSDMDKYVPPLNAYDFELAQSLWQRFRSTINVTFRNILTLTLPANLQTHFFSSPPVSDPTCASRGRSNAQPYTDYLNPVTRSLCTL